MRNSSKFSGIGLIVGVTFLVTSCGASYTGPEVVDEPQGGAGVGGNVGATPPVASLPDAGSGGVVDGGAVIRDAGSGGTGGGTVDAGRPVVAGRVGDVCTVASDCPQGGSGQAVCKTNWPGGGYCAVDGCEQHGHDCPGDPGQATGGSGSKCVQAPTAICLKLCAANTDCRTGYVCASKPDAAGHGSTKVCVPRA